MDKNKKSSSNDDYIQEELKQTNDELASIKAQNAKLIEILKEHDLEDELEGLDSISMEESICINGINHLSKLFESGAFSKDDVQAFDVLHKNYRMIKGQGEAKVKKTKKADVGTLISIAKGIGK